MFKHYLSYQFAIAFHRSCGLLELSPHLKNRLLQSAETMLHQFAQSIHTRDPKDELRFLCVTLICLRDCKETLDEASVKNEDLWASYEVLHGRLEKICLDASAAEGGQFRMFG
jgi:hypothetical protein